jgi:hypothetical protein
MHSLSKKGGRSLASLEWVVSREERLSPALASLEARSHLPTPQHPLR